MNEQTAVKLEILRIAAALTKIAIEQNTFPFDEAEKDKTETVFKKYAIMVNREFNDVKLKQPQAPHSDEDIVEVR